MTNYTIIQNIYYDDKGLVRDMQNRVFGRDDDALANGLYIEDYNRYYFKNGLLHREDGPAIFNPETDYKQWAFNNKYIKCKTQEEFIKIIKLLVFL